MAASVNLATLADAESHLETESLSTEAQAQLTAIIGAASEVIEQAVGRALAVRAGVVEELSVDRGQTRFFVAVYPVTAVNSLKIAWDWDWASADALTEDDDFRVSNSRSILLKYPPTEFGPDAMQINYDGGEVIDEADAKANHPALHEACLQITNLFWTRRGDLLKSGEGGTGWSVQHEAVRVPKATTELLRPYMDSAVLW